MSRTELLRTALARALLALCLVLVGSGQSGCTSPPKRFSGFMESHVGFVPDPSFSNALMYRKAPELDFTGYSALLVEPVVVRFAEGSRVAESDPGKLRELADYLHAAIRRAFEERYPPAESPGPGVLLVSAALTDAVPANPWGNLLALLPPVTLYSYADKALTGTHPFAGGASIELEIRDGGTRERLAAMADRRSGGRFDFRGVTKWGQARAALRHWASALPEHLDMQRARRQLPAR